MACEQGAEDAAFGHPNTRRSLIVDTTQQSSKPRRLDVPNGTARWRWLMLVVCASIVAMSCSSGGTASESSSDVGVLPDRDRADATEIGIVEASLGGSVTIETEVDFSGEVFRGTFVVNDGADVLGCSGGTFVDIPTYQFIWKELTCETGPRTGTISVAFNPTDAPGPGDQNGPWSVELATGEFDGLRGNGEFSVVYDANEPAGVETLTGDITYASVASDEPAEAGDGGEDP